MTDNRNTILAVILSGLVLIGWQYFFNLPQMEKRRAAEQLQSELAKPATQADNAATPQNGAVPTPAFR
jgi:YidC/Oxa1 family membrane protein insertase